MALSPQITHNIKAVDSPLESDARCILPHSFDFLFNDGEAGELIKCLINQTFH